MILYFWSHMRKLPKVLLFISFILFSTSHVHSQWTSIGFGSVANVSVFDLVMDTSSGILYVGGTIQPTGAVSNNIARRIGTQWDSLGAGTDDEILALTMFNGELYAGGYFT